MKITKIVWTTLFIDNDDCSQSISVFQTQLDAMRSVGAEMASWLEFHDNDPDPALDNLAEKINECDYYAALDIWNAWQDAHGTGLELIVSEQFLVTDIPLPVCNRKVKV